MSLGTGVFYTLNEDRPSYALHGINGIRLRQFANGYDRAAVISDKGIVSWVCGGPEPGSEMEQIFDSLKVSSLTFSKDFALMIDEDGKLYSWGLNKSGQLGHGHLDDLLIPHNVDMINRFQVVQCACSETHCACVTKTGGIYTWGRGFEGQTGLFYAKPMNDNYPQGITLKPTYISYFTGKNVRKVACGADFTVVLTEDGSLYTFGNNNLGQLGSGNKNRSYFPLFIVSGEDRKFDDISCGVAHTMARTTEGEVYGWGSNLFGQLGFSKEQKIILGPQKLIINETIGDFYDISCSNNVSAVVDFEGHIWVMGYKNTPVFNQYRNELTSDSNILPPTLLNYKDNYLTNHVSIGYQHILIFVPTYISEIVPSTGPLAGDSPIILKGCGFFSYPNIPITVRFNFGPQQPVQYITGFYDAESDTITCNTPACTPKEIKIEMSDSETETDTDEDSSRKNSQREREEKEKEERKRREKEEEEAKGLSICSSIDICLNGEDFTDEGIQFEYYVTPKINNIIPVNCQCDIPTIISFYAKSYGKAPTDNIKIMFEEIIEQPPKEESKVEEEEEEEILSNSSDEDENESKKDIINENGEEGKVSEIPSGSVDDPKSQTVFVNEEEKKEGGEEKKDNNNEEYKDEMNMNKMGSEIQQDQSVEEEEPESTEPHQIIIQAYMNDVPITDKYHPELAEQLEQILSEQEGLRLFQETIRKQQQLEQQKLEQQRQLEEEQRRLEQQEQEQLEQQQPQSEQQSEQKQEEQQGEEQLEQQQPEEEQPLELTEEQQLQQQQLEEQLSNIPTVKILQCTTPVLDFPIKKPMRCRVKIAMNGMNFDDIEGFEFIFFDIKLQSIIPGYISSEGGYLLNINGSGFVPGLTHQLRLQYGEQVTHYDCEFVSGNLLTLSAPKLDMTIPPSPRLDQPSEEEEQQQQGEGNEENNQPTEGEEKKENEEEMKEEEEEKKDDKEETKSEREEEEGGEVKEEEQPIVKSDCLREYQASITCNGRNYSNTYPYIVYSGEFTEISPAFGQKEGGTLVSIIPNLPILHELTPEQSQFIKVTITSKTQEETLPAVFNVEKQCIEFTTPKLIEIDPPPELVQQKGKADKGKDKGKDKSKADKGKKGKKDSKKESQPPEEVVEEEQQPEPEIIETDPIMKITVSLNQYENIKLSDEIVYTYLPIPELVSAKPNTLKPDGSVNFTGNGFVQSKDIKFKVVSDFLIEPVYVDGTCTDDCKTIQAVFPALPPQQNEDPKMKKSGYPAKISVTLNQQEYSNEIAVTIKY